MNFRLSTRFAKKDLRLMRETFAMLHGRILDIGCGDMIDRVGFTPGDEYVGVDITRSKYTTVIADIHKLPLESQSFDGCICNAVLEHVEQPETALSELNRVLKQNGILWISVPFLQHIHAASDFRRFTGQGLLYEVKKAGFHVDQLHGSYGVLNNIEYLLWAAVGWRIKDKAYKSVGSGFYILALGLLFIISEILGAIFSPEQKKDVHHATSFSVIARKM
ncbi:MAG: class I SAM-dependent methyltransferase [Candidatus Hodarchaeota archaeon]